MRMATITPTRVDKDINLVVLPSGLPLETLENVFIHAARDYHEGSDNRYNICVPHWVNVSYVCSRWRNVALNCPTLWTYHFTASPRWTKELLARSNQASLKICISQDFKDSRTMSWWSRLVQNALSHAGRIQELRLSIRKDVFPKRLSLHVPRLQILDINFSPDALERTLAIYNGDSLSLRILKLSYCSLLWDTTLNLSGVTTLSLRCLCSSSQQDVLEFLGTLSGMQALTVLEVQDSLPSAHELLSSGAFAVSPKVTLPRLIRLFIGAPLSTIIALVSLMGIPLKTQVRLDIEPEFNSSIDKYAQLSSLLAQRFSQFEDLSSSILEIRSLSICFAYNSDFTLSASERCDCDPDRCELHPPGGCRVPLLIRITTLETWMSMSDRAKIVGDICCAIPSIHVQTLRIVHPPILPQFWKKALGHLDGLRHIKLRNGYMPDLASLLTRPADGPSTLVPELEKLELDNIEFDSSGEESWLANIISAQSLLDASFTRKALQLTLTRCHANKKSERPMCSMAPYHVE